MAVVIVKVMVMAIATARAIKKTHCEKRSLYAQNIDNLYHRTLNSLRGFINNVAPQILRFPDPVFAWRHLRMIPK